MGLSKGNNMVKLTDKALAHDNLTIKEIVKSLLLVSRLNRVVGREWSAFYKYTIWSDLRNFRKHKKQTRRSAGLFCFRQAQYF